MERFLRNLAARLLRSDLLRWLETRVMYLPSKDVDKIAEKLGVAPEVVRDIERQVVKELLKIVEKQL